MVTSQQQRRTIAQGPCTAAAMRIDNGSCVSALNNLERCPRNTWKHAPNAHAAAAPYETHSGSPVSFGRDGSTW